MANPEVIPEGKLTLITLDDVEQAFEIISECSLSLAGKGLTHWENWYTEDRVKEIIGSGSLFGYFVDGKLIGVVKLTPTCPYSDEDELKDTSITVKSLNELKPLYLGALAVHPKHQSHGYGSEILLLAERFAKDNGHSNIIIDARIDVPNLIRYYEKKGYFELARFSEIDDKETQIYCVMQKSLG